MNNHRKEPTATLHTATHCNTSQHAATTLCNTCAEYPYWTITGKTTMHTLQHTATHCSTLQHTATHCNTLQHTATHCNILQHTCTIHRTATHCNTCAETPEWTITENRRYVGGCASSIDPCT